MRTILCLLLSACDFKASTEVLGGDTGGVDVVDDSGGDGGAGGGGDGGEAGSDPDPLTVDDDGDGFSEAAGDCDDGDAAVSPAAADRCDGLDQDCDGLIDEDAFLDDPGEPDDLEADDLGVVAEGSPLTATGRLWGLEDSDRYAFAFDDGLVDFYTLYVELDGIPAGASYRLRVEDPATGAVLFSEAGRGPIQAEIGDALLSTGSSLLVVVDGVYGVDCSGDYALTITFADVWPW